MSRSETPIWINPCGAPPPTTTVDIGEEPAVPQSELISRIINQANIAISQAEKFASKFAQKGFSIDYYKDAPRYEWLPDMNAIPKKLGHQLSDDDFRDLQINETLINVYQYLQKFAVGIEQIVWDEDEQNVWDEKEQQDELTFKHLGGNLRNLLCEIQIAIYELRLKPKDDVSRDIMPDDLRKMDNTNTIMRNLLIFRDYMNAVEYIIQVFKYFQDKKT